MGQVIIFGNPPWCCVSKHSCALVKTSPPNGGRLASLQTSVSYSSRRMQLCYLPSSSATPIRLPLLTPPGSHLDFAEAIPDPVGLAPCLLTTTLPRVDSLTLSSVGESSDPDTPSTCNPFELPFLPSINFLLHPPRPFPHSATALRQLGHVTQV